MQFFLSSVEVKLLSLFLCGKKPLRHLVDFVVKNLKALNFL